MTQKDISAISFRAEDIAARRQARYHREEEMYQDMKKEYDKTLRMKQAEFAPMKTVYRFSPAAAIVILILCSSLILHIIGTLMSWDINALLDAGSKFIISLPDKAYFTDKPSLISTLLFIVVTGICWVINVVYTLVLALPCGILELLAGLIPGGRTATTAFCAAVILLLFWAAAVDKNKVQSDNAALQEKARKKAEKAISAQKDRLDEQREFMEQAKASLDAFLGSEFYKNSLYQ